MEANDYVDFMINALGRVLNKTKPDGTKCTDPDELHDSWLAEFRRVNCEKGYNIPLPTDFIPG